MRRQSLANIHDFQLGRETVQMALMNDRRGEDIGFAEAVGSTATSTAGSAGHALSTDRNVLDELPLESVVKIYAVVTSPNYSMPWQMKRQTKSTSSGFIISERRLITNAHSVANQTSVMVRKHGCADKYVAKVLAVGHECDLALLTVDDNAFWQDTIPLGFGAIPNLQDAVVVVGYPTGGDNISVTGGVVSRVEIQTYSHASAALLAIQIDAAINAGNSGGPALRKGKVIGVAFETLKDAENIGYIIPVPVVEHFLRDIELNGTYTGFCSIGFFWQAMENAQFRKSAGVASDQTGVYINRVQPLAKANEVLQKGDVLLEIDNIKIANDGTIPFRQGERIAFRYLVTQKFVGDLCRLKILRSKLPMEVEVELGIIKPLIPVHHYDAVPSYFVHAGLVFVCLSQPYLRNEYGKEWETKAPVKLCSLALDGVINYPDEQVVILSQVLAADVNLGYQLNLANIQLTHLNDQPVRNLRHLVHLINNNAQPYLHFHFENEKVIVLDAELALASTGEILKQHCISSSLSPDMLQPMADLTATPRKGDPKATPQQPLPVGHSELPITFPTAPVTTPTIGQGTQPALLSVGTAQPVPASEIASETKTEDATAAAKRALDKQAAEKKDKGSVRSKRKTQDKTGSAEVTSPIGASVEAPAVAAGAGAKRRK